MAVISNVPKHVAIIMDGNGRWAKRRGLPRVAGHKVGGDTLRKIVRHAGVIGVEHLSVYAFSTENWTRPEEEVSGLIKLLFEYCKKEVPELIKNNVRLKFVGDISRFPEKQRQAMEEAEAKTHACSGLQFNVCINYGGRQDILDAVKKMMTSGVSPDEVTEATFGQHLYTKNIPDPDLLIRTSGELRLSNYYLWQLAYTEMVFVDVLWPDFSEDDFDHCLSTFTQRNRRFGGL